MRGHVPRDTVIASRISQCTMARLAPSASQMRGESEAVIRLPAIWAERDRRLEAARELRRVRRERAASFVERTKAVHELTERVGELRDVAPIEPLHARVGSFRARIGTVEEPDLPTSRTAEGQHNSATKTITPYREYILRKHPVDILPALCEITSIIGIVETVESVQRRLVSSCFLHTNREHTVASCRSSTVHFKQERTIVLWQRRSELRFERCYRSLGHLGPTLSHCRPISRHILLRVDACTRPHHRCVRPRYGGHREPNTSLRGRLHRDASSNEEVCLRVQQPCSQLLHPRVVTRYRRCEPSFPRLVTPWRMARSPGNPSP